MANNVRFGYFEVQTNQGKGYICVAMSRPQKGNVIHEAAFAFCSPREKLFSKPLARKIAESRLRKGKGIVFDHSGGIKAAFVKALGKAYPLPGWVRKNLSNWHIRFGLRGGDERPEIVWKNNEVLIRTEGLLVKESLSTTSS